MQIFFRIIIGIIAGLVAIKLAENKKYTNEIAFLIGFIMPILGNGIIYYSKDKKTEESCNDEENKKLEIFINRLKEDNK